jgi:SP family sugar:H+ symporter-like MFS transporter
MESETIKTSQRDSANDSLDNYASIDPKRNLLEKPTDAERSTCYNYVLAMTIAFGGFPLGYYISILNPMGRPFIEQI